MKYFTQHQRQPSRQGAILIVAMIALIIAMGISTNLIRHVLMLTHHSEHLDARIQAITLADDSVRKIIRTHQMNLPVASGTRLISTSEWPHKYTAKIVTRVENNNQVIITVTCPADRSQFHQIQRILTLSNPEE